MRTGAELADSDLIIAACLAVADRIRSLNANKKTRECIKKLFVHMNLAEVFGRKDIMEAADVSMTAAGRLINKMKEARLIEPLSGHGKGKYRFIVPSSVLCLLNP